ncbi:DNA methylase [Sphingomonas sp. Leaf412]|uniref:DNA methyltransferase n=1 Tax=Sphingomonas sp. Leaf412 TaxID=1736370 RepID=UPI0006FAEEEA|nr:DNA methyltransferase [Sphingomonas sp. Leaf412]KQT34888.1 DNA methylase [Sphingomonas sp. Leaf412]
MPSNPNRPANHLHYGDNLDVLRRDIGDASVDLVYLDPPFNSNATYNILFRSPTGAQSDAQIAAFEDSWHWNDTAERAFDDVARSGNTKAFDLLNAMRAFLGDNDMMAYLAMMAVRLIELHRVLKPTGSLYLHCDPTASHYLKLLLDGVFGPENYLNEIVWRRTGAHNNARRFGPIHDVIHFVRRGPAYRHRPVFRPYSRGHVDAYFRKSDARGRYWTNAIHGAGVRQGDSGRPWRGFDPTAAKRHWAVPGDLVAALGIDPDLPQHVKLDALADAGVIDFPPPDSGGLPTYRQYLDRSPGLLLQDIWSYQPHSRGTLHDSPLAIDEDVRWLTAQGDSERLGYPTQKPVGLLERIVAASSDEGDVVLDPFCGCGTAVHAAQKLGRRWIGIDVTHLAISLIEKRMQAAFPGVAFTVEGTPKDLASAEDLARRDKYQFQWWAVSMVDAMPYGGRKKGADGGIDGIIYFKPDGKRTERALVSVKGGENVGVQMIRDLHSAMEREKAPIGVFVTKALPTAAMMKEAAAVGRFHAPATGRSYPRLQIVTLAELFRGKRPDIPYVDPGAAFRRAAREDTGRQGALL